MKVKEAIEKLKKFNPESKFVYFEYDYDSDEEEFWPISCFKESNGKVIVILE